MLMIYCRKEEEMTDNYSTLKDYALKDMKATNDRLHNFVANLNMKPSRNCQRSCLCGEGGEK